jgi:pilus assembly protein CpaC
VQAHPAAASENQAGRGEPRTWRRFGLALSGTRRPYRKTIALVMAAVVSALVSGLPGSVQAATVEIDSHIGKHAGEMNVPLHKSQILRVDVQFKDLLVGNSEIADVLPLSSRTIYVLGKAIGSTNLSIYDDRRRLIAVVDLAVTHDVEGIKSKLFELLPSERVEVRAAGAMVILSGDVSSADVVDRAVSIAHSIAPNSVKNLLRVRGSQQVLLEVRFAEMSRTTAKQLGFNWDALLEVGSDAVLGLATGAFSTASSGVFPDGTLAVRNDGTSSFFGNFTNNDLSVSGVIDNLEQRGLIKILAEPNLIALSGETARFLAGGEFPIPVDSDDGITIEFKEFGVSLAFTPTVLGDGLINMIVAPEVSQIDTASSVTTLVGADIPGLTTRRATTTIELRDGQSFAIAGLLQSTFADQIEQVPGVGDLPILGPLFRSSEYQRNETELVIIATPRLVKPVKANTLAAPTDSFVAPSDLDIFLHGRTESPQSGQSTTKPGQMLGTQNAGGIDGPYGHIIK